MIYDDLETIICIFGVRLFLFLFSSVLARLLIIIITIVILDLKKTAVSTLYTT